MSRDERSQSSEGASATTSAPLACWFCSQPLQAEYIERDGILRARDDRLGGPYRLYPCPTCGRSNHCEKTRKGRWFSSPTFQPNLLDYIVGKLITPAQEFLRAATWYRENEERRRYYFERDGDRRYSSGAWLRRWLAPGGEAEDEMSAEARRRERRAEREEERKKADERRRHWDREQKREREHDRRQQERREERRRAASNAISGLMSPWEILGVERDADAETVRRAFHRLAVQYHPDKVHHMGEEFQREAHARFTDLQRAYDEMIRRASRNQ